MPKLTKLIKDLVQACTLGQGMVMDFFAGTGTTAESVQILNAEDGSNRKVTLIEQNQPVDQSHVECLRGFSNISDITVVPDKLD